MENKHIYRFGIGTALFFMVLELTYINAKSLLFIVDEFGYIDKVFSIIGSIAFSMVTILVMRTSPAKWMKIVFPLFDAIMVFCGFNLKFADNLTANPIALGLTIFMAAFTGLIMYSLGTIKLKTEIKVNETELNSLNTQLNLLQSKFKQLESDLHEKETENNSLYAENEKLKTQMHSVKSEFNGKETELVKYKAIYLQSEKSRILKKKEENRTPEEIKTLELANQ